MNKAGHCEGTYHLFALQQPVGPEFTSANSASVGGHRDVFVTAMLVTARNTILNAFELSPLLL